MQSSEPFCIDTMAFGAMVEVCVIERFLTNGLEGLLLGNGGALIYPASCYNIQIYHHALRLKMPFKGSRRRKSGFIS